jgi:hypothetical protein
MYQVSGIRESFLNWGTNSLKLLQRHPETKEKQHVHKNNSAKGLV